MLLALLSTVLSTVALAVAIVALYTRQKPSRRLSEITLDLSENIDEIERLKQRFARLQARVSMRAAREKKDDAQPELVEKVDESQQAGETADEWKRRMRAQIARGRLSGR